jgi:hypothetical protein
VRLEIYDLLGRAVGVVHEGFLAAGLHTLTWDAKRLASGPYLAVAIGPYGRLTRVFTVVK